MSIRIHKDFDIVVYDKARNDIKQQGYKYLIKTSPAMSYTAFKTDAGFKEWLERSNLRIIFKQTMAEYTEDEVKKVELYKAKGVIETISFWHMEEIPAHAKAYKGLCNGSIVDCYYVHTGAGAKVFKPNPNAKEVYKPLSLEEQLQFKAMKG